MHQKLDLPFESSKLGRQSEGLYPDFPCTVDTNTGSLHGPLHKRAPAPLFDMNLSRHSSLTYRYHPCSRRDGLFAAQQTESSTVQYSTGLNDAWFKETNPPLQRNPTLEIRSSCVELRGVRPLRRNSSAGRTSPPSLSIAYEDICSTSPYLSIVTSRTADDQHRGSQLKDIVRPYPTIDTKKRIRMADLLWSTTTGSRQLCTSVPWWRRSSEVLDLVRVFRIRVVHALVHAPLMQSAAEHDRATDLLPGSLQGTLHGLSIALLLPFGRGGSPASTERTFDPKLWDQNTQSGTYTLLCRKPQGVARDVTGIISSMENFVTTP